MADFKRTSGMRPIENGLVDYLADGIIIRNGEEIPCEIGYTAWVSGWGGIHEEIEATHIFIKDGITESGNHYCAETIEL